MAYSRRSKSLWLMAYGGKSMSGQSFALAIRHKLLAL